jgi:hypothetical protein
VLADLIHSVTKGERQFELRLYNRPFGAMRGVRGGRLSYEVHPKYEAFQLRIRSYGVPAVYYGMLRCI